ncbi:MAG: hypothetical protein OCC49_16865 [Fibrobacterales bacterium]
MKRILSILRLLFFISCVEVMALNNSRYAAAHSHFSDKAEGSTLYLIVGGIGFVIIIGLFIILGLKSRKK